MNPSPLYVGIDVSQETLVIAFHPKRKLWVEANDNLQELVGRLQALSANLIVMESSGGYEQKLFQALQQANLPVCVENAAHIFHYRKSLGRLVKTDHTDAQVIADYAAQQQERLKPCARKSASVEVLRALLLRRNQLVNLQRQEKNHRSAPTAYVSESCDRVLEALAREIIQLEAKMLKLLEEDRVLYQKALRLESIPGVGKGTVIGLLALLPELGTGNRKEMGALCGVIPYEQSSGKGQGKSRIQGGRKMIRSWLYMAALNAKRCSPTFGQMYERLVSQGKPKKVALSACMHKLVRVAHALIKQETYWQEAANA